MIEWMNEYENMNKFRMWADPIPLNKCIFIWFENRNIQSVCKSIFFSTQNKSQISWYTSINNVISIEYICCRARIVRNSAFSSYHFLIIFVRQSINFQIKREFINIKNEKCRVDEWNEQYKHVHVCVIQWH